MPAGAESLSLLSAMITPAVLISACGTLISTAARLARVVDRVRTLSEQLEQLYAGGDTADFPDQRRAESERLLSLQARRGRYIQRSLTGLYGALGLFVATTITIALTPLLPRLQWLPTAVGIAGALVLFYGCMMLIAETRLALRSVDLEMEFVERLREMYRARHAGRGETPPGKERS